MTRSNLTRSAYGIAGISLAVFLGLLFIGIVLDAISLAASASQGVSFGAFIAAAMAVTFASIGVASERD